MKKGIIPFLLYLLIFAVMFFVSYYAYLQNIALVEIGVGARNLNLIMMVLSVIAILKTVYHLVTY